MHCNCHSEGGRDLFSRFFFHPSPPHPPPLSLHKKKKKIPSSLSFPSHRYRRRDGELTNPAVVAFASVANKQKRTIFHLQLSILKREMAAAVGGSRGWGAGGRMAGGGGGIQADPFGVRDMPADVWSRLMETTVACSPHQFPPPLPLPPPVPGCETAGRTGRAWR